MKLLGALLQGDFDMDVERVDDPIQKGVLFVDFIYYRGQLFLSWGMVRVDGLVRNR